MVGKIRTRKGCEYWYDFSYRVWFAYPVDSYGQQCGDTIDAHDKQDVLDAIDAGLTLWKEPPPAPRVDGFTTTRILKLNLTRVTK